MSDGVHSSLPVMPARDRIDGANAMIARSLRRNPSTVKAGTFRLLFNLYPPFWGTGISIRHIAADYRHVVVEMPLRFYNRNYVGTHFGGSLSAMTDPFYMLMVIHNLGPDYIVWDTAGTIDYRKPGRGRVRAEFRIDQALIDELIDRADRERKFERTLSVDIIDGAGDIVSHVTRTLYVRKKKQESGATA